MTSSPKSPDLEAIKARAEDVRELLRPRHEPPDRLPGWIATAKNYASDIPVLLPLVEAQAKRIEELRRENKRLMNICEAW